MSDYYDFPDEIITPEDWEKIKKYFDIYKFNDSQKSWFVEAWKEEKKRESGDWVKVYINGVWPSDLDWIKEDD